MPDRYWTDRPHRRRIDAENAHARAVAMENALADIGRADPKHDWLLGDKLDEQLKRWKAEDELAQPVDFYGRMES